MPLLGLLLLFSSLLLHSFSLAQHRSLFGKLDVADGYVDLCDPQAYQVFHPVYNVAARRLGDLWDRLTVFYGHRQVDGGFFLADFATLTPRETLPPFVLLPVTLPATPCKNPPTAVEVPPPIWTFSTS